MTAATPSTGTPGFHGCFVATLTPFDATDRVDTGVLRSHVDFLIENGVEGLCPAGTTGEFLFLSAEEKRLVVRETVRAAAGRVPVIAGIWDLRESGILALAAAAEECGAKGIFLPPPIYYPATQEAIYAYYCTIAAVTRLPLFAYNIPQYAANEIGLECAQRLFDRGAIAGIKDSTGKRDRMTDLVSRFGDKGTVFAASDGFAAEAREIGADGFISAIANVAPDIFVRLWRGDDALQPRVTALRTSLKSVGSIQALKHMLTTMGYPFGDARLPCSALTYEQRAYLDGITY